MVFGVCKPAGESSSFHALESMEWTDSILNQRRSTFHSLPSTLSVTLESKFLSE
jgi:hypothetical protein